MDDKSEDRCKIQLLRVLSTTHLISIRYLQNLLMLRIFRLILVLVSSKEPEALIQILQDPVTTISMGSPIV